MTEQDDDRFDRAALERYVVPGAPPEFSARVMTAIREPVRPRRVWWVGGALAAVAGVVIVVAATRGSSTGAAGEHVARGRETVKLATRGVAVLEPGASIRWNVRADGDAAIDQDEGEAFYRVERGGPFAVHTRAGTVSVAGTSFRVELKETAMDKENRRSIKAGAVGAALATVLIVTVYEGRVLLANNQGTVTLGPGESGASSAGEPPRALGAWTAGEPHHEEAAGKLAAGGGSNELARANARIAELENELRVTKDGAKSSGDDSSQQKNDPGRYFAPSQATLLDMAQRCWIAYDLPPFSSDDAVELVSSELASRAKLGEREREQINDAYQDRNEELLAKLRALYVELTGDNGHAKTLSVDALGAEIESKTPPGEELAARRRIARERAGLDPRPTDAALRERPVIERYLRLLMSLGNVAEASAAQVIGHDRARALRSIDGVGWRNSVSDYGGCDADER